MGPRDQDDQPREGVAEVRVVVGQELLSEAAAPGEEQVTGGLPVHQVPQRAVEGHVLVGLVVDGPAGVAEGEGAAGHPGRGEGARGDEEGEQGPVQTREARTASASAAGRGEVVAAVGGRGVRRRRLRGDRPQCPAP